MTTPATVPLTVWRNADYVETWIIAESFDANGDAVDPTDLTGWEGALQVRLYGLAGGDPLIDLAPVTTEIEGVRVLEATGGQLEVRIDAASLEALPAAAKAGASATFSYDLTLTDPAGVTSVYAAGDFTVQPGVTR